MNDKRSNSWCLTFPPEKKTARMNQYRHNWWLTSCQLTNRRSSLQNRRLQTVSGLIGSVTVMKDRKRPDRSSLRFIRADEPTLLEATPTGSEATLQTKWPAWEAFEAFSRILEAVSVIGAAGGLGAVCCSLHVFYRSVLFSLLTNDRRRLSARSLDGNIDTGRFLDWLKEAGRLDGQLALVFSVVYFVLGNSVCVCVCTRGDVGQLPVEATRRHNDNSSRGNNQSTPRWF